MADIRNTSLKRKARPDLSDTAPFVSKRWEDAVFAAQQNLSSADWKSVTEEREWQALYLDIQTRAADEKATPVKKRGLNHMQTFPRTLGTLVYIFNKAISPQEPNFNVLWGMLELNISLSCASPDKLARTSGWMKRLRNVVEIFNRSVDVCEDVNESRYAIIDVLEYLLQIMGESIRHLRNCPTDEGAKKAWWSLLEIKINENMAEIETAGRHLKAINSISVWRLKRRAQSFSQKYNPVALYEEPHTIAMKAVPIVEAIHSRPVGVNSG